MLEHRINAGAEHKPTDHLSMLDSMITARLDQSKLTKLNEIDRQINTFIIAGMFKFHNKCANILNHLFYNNINISNK